MHEFKVTIGKVNESGSTVYACDAVEISDLVMAKIPDLCPSLLLYNLELMFKIAGRPTQQNLRRLHETGWNSVSYDPDKIELDLH